MKLNYLLDKTFHKHCLLVAKKLWAFLVIPFILLLVTANVIAQHVSIKALPVCLGDSSVLMAVTDIPASNIKTYNWDLNNDGYYNDSHSSPLKVLFKTAGINYVGLEIETLSGLKYSTSSPVEIEIYSKPLTGFFASSVCQNTPITFRSTSTIDNGSIITYKWDFGEGITPGFDSVTTHIFNTTGNHKVLLKTISNHNCESTKTETITIFSKPQANFHVENLCEDDSAQFINTSTISGGSISSYIWQFGDSNQEFSKNNFTYKYPKSGSYNVSLIAISDNACIDTTSLQVNINAKTDFSISANPDTLSTSLLPIELTASNNEFPVLWSTGKKGTSIEVSQTANYTATLTNDSGCQTTKSINVYFKSRDNSLQLELANEILTPDDNSNKLLVFKNLENYNNCNLIVFNKWGKVVANISNYQNNWDCSYKGAYLESGAYYYIASSDKKTTKGNFNILRTK